eukprot:CAMPEP_0185602184 /NCGR_PEP_ID=MMETSP0436-20130131/1595_1 /TAXON_ID=626734 ORGANISM="Favella taraikaensis, Strain Fe Narragansett Bay" /NCGR_SAMPLE_ID=MMETSP0436 /ASSEMBLY_ACC=CAM_ASM_000390 /LENGTH=149 /DNA_ID=CAMNT_0028232309 /DNA_START=1090 /DNA_END=1539 /DNA_ORIENTATION=+
MTSLVNFVSSRHEGVVLRALLVNIIVVHVGALLNNLHGFLVDALEQKHCEGRTCIPKEEEQPDAIGVTDLSVEEDGEEEAESGGWVVGRPAHDSGCLTVADDAGVGRRDDQSGDGWVARHLCLLLGLRQVEEGDQHRSNHLHHYGLYDQ